MKNKIKSILFISAFVLNNTITKCVFCLYKMPGVSGCAEITSVGRCKDCPLVFDTYKYFNCVKTDNEMFNICSSLNQQKGSSN